MSNRRAYKITITLHSPFLFAALDIAAPGFDSSALRNASGALVIPGDHLRGHLRHAICALHGEASVMATAIFGSASDDDVAGSRNEPQRGALIVSDLTENAPTEKKKKASIYHRVQIDDETGAADTGMLQLIELPVPIGAVVKFEGRLVLCPAGEGKPTVDEMEQAINNGLRLISAMGAVKSAGFGEVDHDKAPPALTPDTVAPNAPEGWAQLATKDRLRLTVQFDRPLLVDSKRESKNSFSSSTVIPGAAIKGALAVALMDHGKLKAKCPEFAKLSISHAFPLAGDILADRAVPNVIAIAENPTTGQFGAVDALDAHAFSRLSELGTPTFPTDWKPKTSARIREALGRPEAILERMPRGRVAIGADGVAEDAKLFTVNAVETTHATWQFTLDMTGLPEANKTIIREALAGGLDGIGRTGARMMLTCASEAPAASGTKNGPLDILLETSAVLTLSNDGKTPLEQYQVYFKSIGAELITAFAHREWAGGYYGHRFRAFGDDKYCPFELTQPGAVFRLNITDSEKFSTVLTGGLPCALPKRMAEASDWEITPFLPQNGYGEFTIIESGSISNLVKGASQ